MQRRYRIGAFTLLLGVPGVTRAQATRPATPAAPTGPFSTVFRTYTLTDADPRCNLGTTPCFAGSAVWGQLLGTSGPTGYALVVDLRVGPPVVPGTPIFPDYFYGNALIGSQLNPFTLSSFGSTGLLSVSGSYFPAFLVRNADPATFTLRDIGVEYLYADVPGENAVTDDRLVATATPEPSTIALTVGGIAMLGGVTTRRRRNA